MSESPSAYIPRQRRPIRASLTQGARPLQAGLQNGQRVSATDSTVHSFSTGQLIGAPQLAETDTFIHINDADTASPKVVVSGALGSQIYSLSLPQRGIEQAPTVAAFLLGYAEDDGVMCLNRLDSGVLIDGVPSPTAMCSADIAIPLCYGSQRACFYKWAIQTNYKYRAMCWMQGSCRGSSQRLTLEFISLGRDMRVLASPAPTLTIANLHHLLFQLRQGKDIQCGRLQKREQDECYQVEIEKPISPEHPAWVITDSHAQNQHIGRAYKTANAPAQLHVAQVFPSSDYTSATVRHVSVSAASGYSVISVQLASMHLSPADRWTARTAVFEPLNTYDRAIADSIRNEATRAGLALATSPTTQQMRHTPLKLKKTPSRVADNEPSRYPENNDATAGLVAASEAPKPPASSSTTLVSKVNRLDSQEDMGSTHIKEFLEEQRRIRSLLEEQNSLIKAQLAQNQELLHIARHQPSPRPVTRRYLRLRGVHSPAIHDRSAIDGPPDMHKIRRSNSLSEIVNDIRSFEVEGYEETEHHTGYVSRRPFSFAAPPSAIESPSAAGVSSLVSQISSAVSSEPAGATSVQPAFTRPPLPKPALSRGNKPSAAARIPRTDKQNTHKITPTTQKYLDSLTQQQQQQQQQPQHPHKYSAPLPSSSSPKAQAAAALARRISNISDLIS